MNHVRTLPSLSGLESILEPHLGKTAYVVPMVDASGRVLGNNGDHLMISVFHRVLEHLSIRTTADPRAAEVVFVPPNGALLEAYSFPSLLADRLGPFRDRPVVIFPSSALFPTKNPSFIFEGRSAPTIWILREQNSLQHLEESWGEDLRARGVEMILDHDIVASGNQFVRRLIPGPLTPTTVLIAARVDREAGPLQIASTETTAAPRNIAQALSARVPYGPWFTAAVRVARRNKQLVTGERLVESLPGELRAELSALQGNPVISDISATQYATFKEFSAELRRAELVVTNRLHVALPAVILGKRVILVEAGYHKLSGVFDRSLRGLGGVTLVNAQS